MKNCASKQTRSMSMLLLSLLLLFIHSTAMPTRLLSSKNIIDLKMQKLNESANSHWHWTSVLKTAHQQCVGATSLHRTTSSAFKTLRAAVICFHHSFGCIENPQLILGRQLQEWYSLIYDYFPQTALIQAGYHSMQPKKIFGGLPEFADTGQLLGPLDSRIYIQI